MDAIQLIFKALKELAPLSSTLTPLVLSFAVLAAFIAICLMAVKGKGK